MLIAEKIDLDILGGALSRKNVRVSLAPHIADEYPMTHFTDLLPVNMIQLFLDQFLDANLPIY